MVFEQRFADHNKLQHASRCQSRYALLFFVSMPAVKGHRKFISLQLEMSVNMHKILTNQDYLLPVYIYSLRQPSTYSICMKYGVLGEVRRLRFLATVMLGELDNPTNHFRFRCSKIL